MLIFLLSLAVARAEGECDAVRQVQGLAAMHHLEDDSLRALSRIYCESGERRSPSRSCQVLSSMEYLARMGEPGSQTARTVILSRRVYCALPASEDPERWNWSSGVTARTTSDSWNWPSGVTARSASGALYYPSGTTARGSDGRWKWPSGTTASTTAGSWYAPDGSSVGGLGQLLRRACEAMPTRCEVAVGQQETLPEPERTLALMEFAWFTLQTPSE
ncbi:MAG: hypothetical protein JXX28_07365 [Deltaproteobacteria bacterium]|nr:hypothetical protein [Deltaproteobacteria bacterium]